MIVFRDNIGFFSSNITPPFSCPFCIISKFPPEFNVTTGNPEAIASNITLGEQSSLAGNRSKLQLL